jgi:hypothetical protein
MNAIADCGGEADLLTCITDILGEYDYHDFLICITDSLHEWE